MSLSLSLSFANEYTTVAYISPQLDITISVTIYKIRFPNSLQSYFKRDAFIVTHAPHPEYQDAFWNLIFEVKPQVIVYLNNCQVSTSDAAHAQHPLNPS